MDLSEVFRALGRSRFQEVIESISLGRLRTYQVYDSLKVRAHLSKLNRERLRRAIPKLWERLEDGDQELARELAQGVLVSNLPLVVDVLDFLEVPHDGSGFFEKDSPAVKNLKEGWQTRVLEKFRGQYPESIILLYTNHLAWETGKASEVFLGTEQASG